MDVNVVHLLLVLFIFSMFFIALAYLSRQRLSFSQFALWGLAALLIPVLGPFLVITLRPGRPR